MLCGHDWGLISDPKAEKAVYKCTKCKNKKRYNVGMWEFWVNGEWFLPYNYKTGEWAKIPF